MGVPALVLSGQVNALGVIRGLGEKGVPVFVLHARDDDMAQASKYVRQSFRTCDPVVADRGFLEAILEHRDQLRGALLIPTSDETLAAVARSKGELESDFVVGCPGWDTIRVCLDKALTARLAEEWDIPAPRTVLPRTLDEAMAASPSLGFPLLVKPAQSHLYFRVFRRKMACVANAGELELRFSEAAAAGLDVMLQEIIPGGDDDVVNYNSYSWGGAALVEFTARQLRKAPPRYGSPRVLISEWIPDAIEPGRATIAALGFSGFANIELKRDARDGRFKLMEINARHNMSSLLAVRCGVNFPMIEYRHRIRGELPRQRRQRQGFYWSNNLQDLAFSVRGLRSEGLTLPEYLAPYAHPHCDAILDRRDLRPWLARVSHLGRRAWLAGAGAARDAANRPRGRRGG
jgi:D-aspartate ligase